MTQRVAIQLFPDRLGHRVAPGLFGHFIEHLGGCIYDGIWVGPHSPIPNEAGLRLDTVEALQALQVPVLRWPGGLWADSYHWQDGVGPAHQRPVRQNLGWNTVEHNAFGTHEFMHLCRLIGAAPYLCCNLGSGTVEEARSWAEYCNGVQDTTLVRQRRANGHPEPFGVRYWGLGNEAWYPLDGMMLPDYYTHRARHYAGYIKHYAAQATLSTDPSFRTVQTILALRPDWLATFAEIMGQRREMSYFDLISLHFYTGKDASPGADPAETYGRIYDSLAALERQLGQYCQCARELSSANHKVGVAVDEWGIWHHEALPRHGLAQRATLGDALYAAACLQLFQRHEEVALANLAQTANVLQALVLTKGSGFCLTPTYHAFEMLGPHREGLVMEARIAPAAAAPLAPTAGTAPARDTAEVGDAAAPDEAPDPPGAAELAKRLSVAATVSADGRSLFLSLANLDLAADLAVELQMQSPAGWAVTGVRRLAAEEVEAANTLVEPRHVRPAALPAPQPGDALLLPAASLTTVALARQPQERAQ